MALLETWLIPLAFVAALGSGLMGGMFFTFSNSVMKALQRLRTECGMAAMQTINITVINPAFLPVFLGTALISLLLIGLALLRWQSPGAGWLALGGVLYFLGNFVVTLVCNVPRNNALARMHSAHPDAAGLWQRYLVEWTRWNHVRALTAVAASASFIAALCRLQAAAG